jgi:exodeoxyribonuclease V gamma subunit
VQSRGMERWLSMEIARRQGICANFRFPFPQAFAEEAFAAVSGVVPETEAFAPEVMAWKLMKIIPSFLEQPGFEQLRRYLKGKKPPVAVPDGESTVDGRPVIAEGDLPGAGDVLKRFQLASRVARLFDQYLIFRPEMMMAWEKGAGAFTKHFKEW